ncbi:hypothetical protein F0L68_23460 [Solihabitans fulvus]|uniref:Uncharacterized protein n=1 Tax=Solihabitans fulvus TaxID=1892852 RepID=A0A5B2X6E7_9PSEU|nr:hypothetical protein [Solihabitans fulvus]KAA2258786.1 hypothetical protein F0L68_23460 [Solihabitans fulvus]
MAWDQFCDCLGGDFEVLKTEASDDTKATVEWLINTWNSLDSRVKAVLTVLFGWYGKDALAKIATISLVDDPVFWAAVAGVGLGTFVGMAYDCWDKLEAAA